jgi:hypothetical protein
LPKIRKYCFLKVKLWGRYIAPPEQMYANYNNQTEQLYEIVFKRYKREDVTTPWGMTHDEFESAKVDFTVKQMTIKCGYSQTVYGTQLLFRRS